MANVVYKAATQVRFNAAASGTLTLTGNFANGETVKIGPRTYTARTTLTNVDGYFLIGATASDSIDNLIAAILLGAGSGTIYAAVTAANVQVTAAVGAGDTMTATALDGSTVYGVSETSANASWTAPRYIALRGPTSLDASVVFTLPNADGAAGQPLTTDGAGGWSFGTSGGSGANQLVSTWILTLPFLVATTATTNHKWLDIANASGRVYLGTESATGNNLIAGGAPDAYAAVLTTPVGGGKLLIGTENTRRIEIAATGEVTIAKDTEATVGGVGGLVTAGGLFAAKKIIAGTSISPSASAASWTAGAGSPEGVVGAAVGSIYSRTDGGAGTSFYVKESGGVGNTGWVAK